MTALRTVRSQASVSYSELHKETVKMTLDLDTRGNLGHQQDNSSHGQGLYQQGPYQAKNTLQRYNNTLTFRGLETLTFT